MNKRPAIFAVCSLLTLVTMIAYWPLTGHKFIDLDDPLYICDNPHVKAGLTWSGVLWAFQSGYTSNWHPLTWISHMVDCQLYGLNPAGHQLDEAVRHLTAAVKHNPAFAHAYINLGKALLEQGKLDEAVAPLSSAVRLTPDDPEAQYNLGTVLLMQAEPDEAIACFSAALRLRPDYGEAHGNLGIALMRQAKPGEGAAHLSTAAQPGRTRGALSPGPCPRPPRQTQGSSAPCAEGPRPGPGRRPVSARLKAEELLKQHP